MSDIFNEYAKKAIEQGLVKEASEVSDETNQRFDSLSDDDIRSLYDVRPNGEEEKHILDQAHPESVVVAPSYDRMNGLVENLFERQDIMAWIATKPNDGKLTQKRYVKASQDLTMALLNTAFLLDRTGDTELMRLADSCASRMTKEAIAPLVLWGVGLGVTYLASAGIINNFGAQIDSGVQENARRAIDNLNALLEAGKASGREMEINELVTNIQYIKDLNEELTSFNIDNSLGEESTKSQMKEGKAKVQKYIEAIKIGNKEITSFLNIIRAHAESAGLQTWMSEYLGDFGRGLEKGWKLLAGTHIGQAADALETLRGSLGKSIASISKLYSAVKADAQSGNHESIEELLDIKSDESKEEGAGSGMKQKKEEDDTLTQFMPSLKDKDPFAGKEEKKAASSAKPKMTVRS